MASTSNPGVRRWIGALALLVLGCGPATPAQENLPFEEATTSIAQAFEDAHLVAIGESHRHQELYDFLADLLRNPAIQAAVDDIVVEYGNALYQNVLDRYIRGDPVPLDSVRLVWRNTISSPNTVWDSPVYETFFETVRTINASLPPDRRYRVLAGDHPVNWDVIERREDLIPFFQRFRSEHIFQVVRQEVLRKNRKGLLIAGGVHTSRQSMVRQRDSGLQWAETSAGSLIASYFPDALFVIGANVKEGIDHTRLSHIPKGSLVRVEGTWLGTLEANVVTNMRNFDGSPFTLYGDARLEDMVDAILYWGPPEAFTYAEPPPDIYQDDAYWATLNRRSLLIRGQPMDSTLRH